MSSTAKMEARSGRSRPRLARWPGCAAWAGIDTLSALGLCAESGDFGRVVRPTQLISFSGLVPSEGSTGDKRRQGAITKLGSDHARRLLEEVAWHYRRAPRVGVS
jgi:transposase